MNLCHCSLSEIGSGCAGCPTQDKFSNILDPLGYDAEKDKEKLKKFIKQKLKELDNEGFKEVK